ncbi:hypothetical protein BACEGG_00376 [Bacteroides eggerthii DSM 20697]|nr:hypothetical protein BACEGG_00376 [Bacteroides eggerthii DSM 20697]
MFEVEHFCMDDFFQVYVRIITFDYFGSGLQGVYDLPDAFHFFGLDFRYLVQQDDITEFNLLDDKILDVLVINSFSGKIVAARKFTLQAQGIHYGSDAVQAADAVFGVHAAHSGYGTDGLGDRFRFANAAGFNDDIVETLHSQDFAYLFYQIHLQGAADASVLKCDKAFIFFANDTAFLNKVCINVHFAYVVDNDGKLDPLFIAKDMVY